MQMESKKADCLQRTEVRAPLRNGARNLSRRNVHITGRRN